MWNAAILTVPNFIQADMFSKTQKQATKDFVDMARRDPAKLAAAQDNYKGYLAAAGKGVASEGLWEENIQSAVQAYEKRLANGESDEDFISGPLHQMVKNA